MGVQKSLEPGVREDGDKTVMELGMTAGDQGHRYPNRDGEAQISSPFTEKPLVTDGFNDF